MCPTFKETSSTPTGPWHPDNSALPATFEESNSSSNRPWHPDDKARPAPSKPGSSELFRPDILETIEAKIKELDGQLRDLSLDIHAHPELGYEEFHAHDVYTSFMEKQGFVVTRQFHLQTAWKAEFRHGSGGRTIGLNSEMDALKGVGHACGHNLIGMSGVAVACALKAALEKHDIPGNVTLLGTPAEEGGLGKFPLLDKGAYTEMDICLMCHPAPGPVGSVSLSSSYAVKKITAHYKGHPAHAALSPWEGKNALDAAVLAYTNVAALRQQLRPTTRVHGIIEGDNWATNIIPDNARFALLVRGETLKELTQVADRVEPCLRAAALATGCEVKFEYVGPAFDLRQNKALGKEVANIVVNKYGAVDYEWGIRYASTDFGNVTYALPSLHPGFAIPTVENGGNHTRQFTESAATAEAHQAALDVSKALAGTGIRVLLDDDFFAEVKRTFEEDKRERGSSKFPSK